jgi:hypothetical protein
VSCVRAKSSLAASIIALLLGLASSPAAAEWPLDFWQTARVQRENGSSIRAEADTGFIGFLTPGFRSVGQSYFSLSGLRTISPARSSTVPIAPLLGENEDSVEGDPDQPSHLTLQESQWRVASWMVNRRSRQVNQRPLSVGFAVRVGANTQLERQALEVVDQRGRRIRWDTFELEQPAEGRTALVNLVLDLEPARVSRLSLWFSGRGAVVISDITLTASEPSVKEAFIGCGTDPVQSIQALGMSSDTRAWLRTSAIRAISTHGRSQWSLSVSPSSEWQAIHIPLQLTPGTAGNLVTHEVSLTPVAVEGMRLVALEQYARRKGRVSWTEGESSTGPMVESLRPNVDWLGIWALPQQNSPGHLTFDLKLSSDVVVRGLPLSDRSTTCTIRVLPRDVRLSASGATAGFLVGTEALSTRRPSRSDAFVGLGILGFSLGIPWVWRRWPLGRKRRHLSRN